MMIMMVVMLMLTSKMRLRLTPRRTLMLTLMPTLMLLLPRVIFWDSHTLTSIASIVEKIIPPYKSTTILKVENPRDYSLPYLRLVVDLFFYIVSSVVES